MKATETSPVPADQAACVALGKFIIAITQAKTDKQLFAHLAEHFSNILPADRSSVTLLNGAGDELEIFALNGSTDVMSVGKYLPVDNSLVGQAVTDKRTYLHILDPACNKADSLQLLQQNLACCINAPLIVAGSVIGTVNVASFTKDAYSDQSVELMTLVSTLTATYLERQQLLETSRVGLEHYRDYSYQLEILNNIAEDLSAAVTEDEVFSAVTQSVARAVSAERVSYIFPDNHQQLFNAQTLSTTIELPLAQQFPVANSALEVVMNSGRPHFFENLCDSDYEDHIALRQSGIACTWSVPVRINGAVAGVLNASSTTIVVNGRQQLDILAALGGILGVTLERIQAQRELEYQARFDSLTGLPNRHQFNDTIDTIIATEEPTPFMLLFIDLDRFKVVNDTLGHDIGDQLLQRVTRRICRMVREDDLVARLGGDEFVVLLPGTHSTHIAETTSQRIITALKAPFQISCHDIFIGASIGISRYPEHSNQSTELIKCADIAMYHAKKQGRNNFQFYNDHLLHNINFRRKIDNHLHLAIANNELYLLYQPLLEQGRITGVEALLRWQNDELGEIGPSVFIPVAEESPLIESITFWVLKQSLSVVKQLRSAYPDLYVSINISARDCLSPDLLIKRISATLASYGLPGSALVLEITESVFLQNTDTTNNLLAQLKHHGIRIAIDDFGTGFSSLTYLLDLPLDMLKIDQSFTQDIHTSTSKVGVVKGILEIADSLSISCIAEGIEVEEQHSCLQKLGCTRYQGYLISYPLPLTELEQFLIRQGDQVLMSNDPSA